MIKHPFFFWLSMAALVVMVLLVAERAVFMARAERTNGEVTRVIAYNGQCGSRFPHHSCTMYTAVVRYLVDDAPYFLSVGAGNAPDYNRPTTLATHQVGQRVQVIFDPRRPAKAFSDTFAKVFGGASSSSSFTFHFWWPASRSRSRPLNRRLSSA